MKAEVKYIGGGKSTTLTSQIKPILIEQNQRLSYKHHIDIDLLDDLRTFIKVKCNIEKDYSNALIKLINSHQKKYPSFAVEQSSDTKSLYTSWKAYLDEIDKNAKLRLTEYETVSHAIDTLKDLKTHKVSVGKRTLDQHLKKMHEEINTTVLDLDKHRKIYQEDEHFAKQARDKEEKLMKKKTGGIFAKLTDLQTKKEKTSSHREASEIQSTQARNEYIMALASTNAHLHHFYSLDLPTLMNVLDDEALTKCRLIILTMIQKDLSSLNSLNEGISKANSLVSATSTQFTNEAFVTDPSNNCLDEEIQIEFEPVANDSVRTVSTEHNADLALQHDINKWLSCFQKECRNLCRLNTQLIKCQNLASSGHKTVEVRGVGQVNLDTQIEEVKQQIRKCDISKAKAYARLLAIREGGMDIEDLITLEATIKNEMKATTATLDVDSGHTALSRTPSVKSTDGTSEGRVSGMDKSFSEDDTNHTPEPEQYVRDSYDQDDSDNERDTPYSSNQYSSNNSQQQQQPQSTTVSGGWTADWGDDPTAAWSAASEPPVAAAAPSAAPLTTGTLDSRASDAPVTTVTETTFDNEVKEEVYNNVDSSEQNYDESTTAEEAFDIDGTLMVGKLVRALYPYTAQNADELDLTEEDTLTVISASDKDWVNAQNVNGQIGFVPAAYLEIIGDAPPAPSQDEYDEVATYETNFVEEEPSYTAPSIAEICNKEAEEPVEEATEGEYARALYDYEATSGEEISFSEGDLIRIIERSEDGWWTGEKDGVVGHFPSMLVSELGDEDEEEDEEEAEEEDEENDEDAAGGEEGAFPIDDDGEDEEGSPGSVKASPFSASNGEGKNAPPSFAPPKPINLIPQQIVIMQPTPEIESRGTFGEGVEDDYTNSGDAVTREDEEVEAEAEAESDVKEKEVADANNNRSKSIDDDDTTTAAATKQSVVIDSSFKLDQPPSRGSKVTAEDSTTADLPPPPSPEELAMVTTAGGRPIPNEPTVEPPSPPEPNSDDDEVTREEEEQEKPPSPAPETVKKDAAADGEVEEEDEPLPPPPPPQPQLKSSDSNDISEEIIAEPHILDDVKEEEEPEEEASKNSSSSTETEVEVNQPDDTDDEDDHSTKGPGKADKSTHQGSDSEPDLK